MGVNKLYNIYEAGKQILKNRSKLSKIAPDITQPRQLKTTMQKMRKKFEEFGFKKAKTADDRANIVRTKKSIERMENLDKAKAKVKTGEQGKKEVQKMVDTGQATKIGDEVFHKSVKEKKAKGGRIGFKKGTGRSGVPAVDIKSTPTKKLSEKQKKIAMLAGDPKKIDKPDFAKLRNRKKFGSGGKTNGKGKPTTGKGIDMIKAYMSPKEEAYKAMRRLGDKGKK